MLLPLHTHIANTSVNVLYVYIYVNMCANIMFRIYACCSEVVNPIFCPVDERFLSSGF